VTDWLLRWPWLAERFHSLVKRRKIVSQRSAPVLFERHFEWDGPRLVVTDIVTKLPRCPAIAAVSPADDVEVHSPSGRLAGSARRITSDLETSLGWAQRLETDGRLILQHVHAETRDQDLEFHSIRILDADLSGPRPG
jgi:hypothetical protein